MANEISNFTLMEEYGFHPHMADGEVPCMRYSFGEDISDGFIDYFYEDGAMVISAPPVERNGKMYSQTIDVLVERALAASGFTFSKS